MPERDDVITLLDEAGHRHDFTLVDVIEVDAQKYALLEPAGGGEGAVVFRVDDDTLVPVEDDAEFDRVVEALQATEDYDDVAAPDGDAGDDRDA